MKLWDIYEEISSLKLRLYNSDYEIIKSFESIIGCTSATKIVSALKEANEQFSEVIANRESWRARINELQAMLPELEEKASNKAEVEASDSSTVAEEVPETDESDSDSGESSSGSEDK